MKKLICSIVLVSMMFVGAGSVFAGSTDFYMSVPIAIDRTNGDEVNTTAIGGGIKLSTADNNDLLGVSAGLTVYYPLAISWTTGGISTTDVSSLYSVPLGLDMLVGVDVNLLSLGFISFPLNLGVHSKVDFYKAGTQVNFGLAGTVGGQLNLGPLGVFARAQISYDFYRTHHISGKGWTGGNLNQWGIQPQIGVSLSL